jgi:hypothetical protein
LALFSRTGSIDAGFVGMGWPKEYLLKEAEPSVFTPPRIRFSGGGGGYDLTSIAHVETEQQRVALALFREASSSNNDYLSFLFYWQVLETGSPNPVDLDQPLERQRLTLSTRVIAAFARYYIREVLGLKNTLHLVQRKTGDIPVYADRNLLADRSYKLVPPKYWRTSQKLLGKSGRGNIATRE